MQVNLSLLGRDDSARDHREVLTEHPGTTLTPPDRQSRYIGWISNCMFHGRRGSAPS